jgi:hypothetical protein
VVRGEMSGSRQPAAGALEWTDLGFPPASMVLARAGPERKNMAEIGLLWNVMPSCPPGRKRELKKMK